MLKNAVGSLLTKMLGTKVNGDVIEKVAGVLDEYKFTAEEMANAEMQYEQELTKRLQADMASDNWLAKSIRPLGFAAWTILMLFIVLFDGNAGGFTIRESYLPLIESVYITYLGFYVGSRGVEKSIKLMQESKDKK